MGWVRSSFKTQNERIKHRRSVRVEKTAPIRAAKRKAMMVVVKITIGSKSLSKVSRKMSDSNKPTARVHDLQPLPTLPVTIIGAGKGTAHVPERLTLRQ